MLDKHDMSEYILCAAISLSIRDNEPPIVIGGYRHGDCFTTAINMGYANYISQDKQGFITSTGRFVDRKEAKVIARNANQLLRDSVFENLISEDIY